MSDNRNKVYCAQDTLQQDFISFQFVQKVLDLAGINYDKFSLMVTSNEPKFIKGSSMISLIKRQKKFCFNLPA